MTFNFRSLGVSQLGVVVNKMDTVNWSKDRFDEIVNKLKVFLRQAGFKESDVTYIPCSGMSGENLVKPPTESQLLSWYNGPTLSSVIGKNLAIFSFSMKFSHFPRNIHIFHSSKIFQTHSKYPSVLLTRPFVCR